MYWLLKFLPKNHISYLVGMLARIPLPRPLASITVNWYVKRYNVDLSCALRSIESFRCVGELFARELRADARPIANGIVSPVDGTLRSIEPIENDRVEQVKGKSYLISDLLGGLEQFEIFRGGWVFNLYLAPKDYHHFHAPVSGQIESTQYFPGNLWPVNDWSLKNIDSLFSRNERVVSYFDYKGIKIAMVMVGATNVGRIKLSYTNLVTNSGGGAKYLRHSPAIEIEAGEKIGTFELGSTVIMCISRCKLSNFKTLGDVIFGARLADIE